MVIAVIESINYAYSNYKYIPWNVDFIENFFLLQIVWIIKKTPDAARNISPIPIDPEGKI